MVVSEGRTRISKAAYVLSSLEHDIILSAGQAELAEAALQSGQNEEVLLVGLTSPNGIVAETSNAAAVNMRCSNHSGRLYDLLAALPTSMANRGFPRKILLIYGWNR